MTPTARTAAGLRREGATLDDFLDALDAHGIGYRLVEDQIEMTNREDNFEEVITWVYVEGHVVATFRERFRA